MPTFEAWRGTEARPAVGKVIVPVNAFACSWADRPKAPVTMGLRLLCAEDAQVARAEAAKKAWKLHPHRPDTDLRDEVYTESLMHWVVARCTCDPFDVLKPPAVWRDMPDTIVEQALNRHGAKWIYDEIDTFAYAESPKHSEATVDEIAEFFELLPVGLMKVDAAQASRMRRLIYGMLEELREVVPDTDE